MENEEYTVFVCKGDWDKIFEEEGGGTWEGAMQFVEHMYRPLPGLPVQFGSSQIEVTRGYYDPEHERAVLSYFMKDLEIPRGLWRDDMESRFPIVILDVWNTRYHVQVQYNKENSATDAPEFFVFPSRAMEP